jgi:uncharacterized protein YprB with RNaseH-like and TPR domain
VSKLKDRLGRLGNPAGVRSAEPVAEQLSPEGTRSERITALRAQLSPEGTRSERITAPRAQLAPEGTRSERITALRAQLAPEGTRSERITALRAQLARVGAKRTEVSPRPPFHAAGLEEFGARADEARTPAAALRAAHVEERGAAQARVVRDEECAVPAFEERARVSFARGREGILVQNPRAGLPGERSETALGPLRSLVTLLPEDHRHGAVPVALALAASAQDLALLALDPGLAGSDFTRALYIDTETTGLSGGAGTLPFVIGMAWFEDGSLRVEQLLLERPGLESPMLARLAERMRAASAVVSFNGKSFDWPLLRTRFVLTRVAAPPLPPHLDLLHCARRIYKRRLGSVRLVHLEEQILGFTRIEDIDGALIPQTYLGFLRGHVSGAALAPILEHNRSDLVALAAMLGELARRFCGERPAQDARDQLGFAGVAARGQALERALLFARGAAEADLRGELAPEAHCLAAELCLRTGDLASAERSLLLAVETACGDGTRAGRAHLLLAKLYEHQLKRLDAALEHAARALAHEGADAGERRLARLRAKQKKRASRPIA